MKNLLFVSLILLFFALGCQQSNSGRTGFFDFFGANDETDQAIELVNKANEDLREIRKIQRANISKFDALKQAITNRDSPSVKQILDELIAAIESGLKLAETAAARIDEAVEKKTNEKFNEYLRLKEQVLAKQIEAFRFRLQVAKTLREKFGTDDAAEIEAAKTEFARQEANFQKLWEAAEDLNDRATGLARENPSKIKAK